MNLTFLGRGTAPPQTPPQLGKGTSTPQTQPPLQTPSAHAAPRILRILCPPKVKSCSPCKGPSTIAADDSYLVMQHCIVGRNRFFVLFKHVKLNVWQRKLSERHKIVCRCFRNPRHQWDLFISHEAYPWGRPRVEIVGRLHTSPSYTLWTLYAVPRNVDKTLQRSVNR